MTEVDRVKPRAMFVEEAIQAALESRWAEAVTINEQLVERHGGDEEAYNRLGKALSEVGRLKDALVAYEKSLELNPLNVIAQKNQRKLGALLAASEKVEGMSGAIDVDLFTEEPGKSALTVLSAPSERVTVSVAPGDVVELHPQGSSLIASTVRGVTLGEVDTKITRRLLPLIASGNRYTAAVARADSGHIEVMIREAFQAPENARKSSFPIARGARRDEFRPYAKESLLISRGADLETSDDEEYETQPGGADEPDDELEGMQTVEGDLDEAGAFEVEDDSDDDVRPEDEY